MAPPAAERGEAVAAAAGREGASSASWLRLSAGRPRLRLSPAGRTWRSAPPEE